MVPQHDEAAVFDNATHLADGRRDTLGRLQVVEGRDGEGKVKTTVGKRQGRRYPGVRSEEPALTCFGDHRC